MKKLILFSTLTSTLALTGLFSPAAEAVEIGPAGCGLGNVVFGKDNQVLAATTNGTSGNQTFGITSGTSNCVRGDTTAQLLNFLDANRLAFNKDAARGEGETIAGLATIVGCKNPRVLGASLKRNYETLFPSDNVSSAAVTQRLQDIIATDAELASQCSIG